MAKRPRLGEMLVDAGLISQEQLRRALSEHKRYGLKLGEYLIHNDYVREADVLDLISRQMRVKKYDPQLFTLDPNLSKLVPADIAQQHKVVPLQKKMSLLLVATTDPLDINALDAVEIASNMEVEPVICTEQVLQQLFSSQYGAQMDGGSPLEDIQEDMALQDGDSAEEDAGGDVEVSSLQDMAEDAPVIRLVNSLLAQAIRDKASDIHVSPEKKSVQVRFRIDGKLQEVPGPPKNMFLPVVSRLKILANMDIATSRIPQDGRFTVNMEGREINVRTSTMPTIHGENLVMRLLDMSASAYSLADLGLAGSDREKMEKIISRPYGMILATGPTGSGKSTTLYAVLQEINSSDLNIITLEDPVEYRVPKIRQAQLNRRAGMTFASGLRSILRQDPDVVMVGEIRDFETANIAIQAALTGHRLLSTVHTNDAAGAVTRLVDMGVEPFLVSSSLLAAVGQRLVRRVCKHCQEEYTPEKNLLEFWGISREEAEEIRFVHGKGCYHCKDTGYRGRLGVYEILLNDEQIQGMILRRASSHEIARAAHKAGNFRMMHEDALEKAKQGLTTLEEITSAVMT
ncbi:MAG: GspE/PulE family protein [Desulfonatronovibrionaceae bacterium]